MMAILIFVALAINCIQIITGNKKNQNYRDWILKVLYIKKIIHIFVVQSMRYGVMAAQQILALLVQVQLLVSQLTTLNKTKLKV